MPDKTAQADHQLQQGLALHRQGQVHAAEQCYNDVLRHVPDHADALHLLGVIHSQTGRPDGALRLLRKALAVSPDNPVFHNSLANVLQLLGHTAQALEHYQRAIALNPIYSDALVNFAKTLVASRQYAQAIRHYDRALALRADAQVWNLRGVACHLQRDYRDALDSYARALALDPRHIGAVYNQGSALAALGQLPEALACFDKVIALEPDNAGAHENRGNVLKELRRLDEAIVSYKAAIALQPDTPFLLGALRYARHQICDWDGIEDDARRINERLKRREKVTPGFPHLALSDDPSMHKIAEEVWASEKFPSFAGLDSFPRRNPAGRIKLGYYSADFHNHATAYLTASLFEMHDRSRFEVIGFSFGPDKDDVMRRRLKRSFDQFHDVRARTGSDIARLSRELGIDIAFDLKGYTTDARPEIFASRCAPIQVSYLGYPGTMGAEFMDYLIADPVLIPEQARHHYTEKIVYLPHSYQVNDPHRPIAPTQWRRTDLGLPAQGFVFCCFNNNYKILPAMFDCWMRLLHHVPDSVLWLYEGNPIAANNLRREARRRGVNDERLVFAKPLPLPEHLARYRLADLFLDTLPCNAHTTASDALWAGLPVLTQIGKAFAGRVAASLLSALGLPELITCSEHAYEAQARALATEPDRLERIKMKLQTNLQTAPLFNTPMFMRHFENACEQMMGRYQSGMAPDHLYVVA